MKNEQGELEKRRKEAMREMMEVGPMRLGSLFHRYRRCGKAGCACSDPEHRGHGCWVVVKRHGKRTMMTTVRENAVGTVRKQLEEGKRFWALATEFAEASDALARERLDEPRTEEAEKRGSKSPSTRKSKPKSKR